MKLKALTAAAAIGAALALFFSPHLTLMQMRSAAEARDAVRLSSHVDFEALRAQLKRAVQQKIADQDLDAEGRPTPASAMGAAVAGALLGPLVDALLTPDSLARLLQGQSPARAAAGGLGGEPPERSSLETAAGYESPNRFVFSIARHGEAPVELVLHRERLVIWKLAELRLP